MNMREEFEEWHRAKYPLHSMLLGRRENGEYSYPSRREMFEVWQAALSAALDATTCPGHGRSECVSCCWPKGDMPTAAADGYRDGRARVQELIDLLILAKAHVPVTDPLRGLINANLTQHLIEQGPQL